MAPYVAWPHAATFQLLRQTLVFAQQPLVLGSQFLKTTLQTSDLLGIDLRRHAFDIAPLSSQSNDDAGTPIFTLNNYWDFSRLLPTAI
jgi:hypothetical protein